MVNTRVSVSLYNVISSRSVTSRFRRPLLGQRKKPTMPSLANPPRLNRHSACRLRILICQVEAEVSYSLQRQPIGKITVRGSGAYSQMH